jgi:hypothetical protein
LWSKGSSENRFRGSIYSREVVNRRSGEVVVASYKLRTLLGVGNTGVQLTVGRYGVLVDVGCGLGS